MPHVDRKLRFGSQGPETALHTAQVPEEILSILHGDLIFCFATLFGCPRGLVSGQLKRLGIHGILLLGGAANDPASIRRPLTSKR